MFDRLSVMTVGIPTPYGSSRVAQIPAMRTASRWKLLALPRKSLQLEEQGAPASASTEQHSDSVRSVHTTGNVSPRNAKCPES